MGKSTDDIETPTVEKLRKIFGAIASENQAENIITDIKEGLRTKDTDKLSKWNLHIQNGLQLLKFVDEHAGKIDAKDTTFQSGEGKQMMGSILKQIGNVHWVVAGLSVIGYIVSKCAKMSENQTQCRELVQEMIPLLQHILLLKNLINEKEEEFEEALVCIIEESIWCVQQQDPDKFPNFVRFFKSSVDSQRLSSIQSKMKRLKAKFLSMASTQVLRHTAVRKGILPQCYPENAVGIDHQVTAVWKLITIKSSASSSSCAVVLYGLGGIGKSTIAKAVVSEVNRECCNFVKIDLDSIGHGNDYMELQRQILNDGFPSYESGRKIDFRDTSEGRYHITKACMDKTNKPVFLFIDNVKEKEQLEKILPEDLRNFPKGTTILITTRVLTETDVIEDRGLELESHEVKKLSEEHALEILKRDPVTAVCVDIKGDVKKIKEIISLCSGIPMVLKVVRGHLRKNEYNVDLCTEIIRKLKTGEKIKEDRLSDCLFEFVYDKLEDSAQQAFLDICCCFHEHWLLRHVKYIVGHDNVTSLAEAAFISTAMANQEEMLSVHNLIRNIGLLESKFSRIIDDEHWSKVENDKVTMNQIKSICVDNKSCMLEKKHFLWMEEKLGILSWKGCINIPAKGVRVPQMRCIKTDRNVDWMIVEADDKLCFLECEKLPIKLPKSLRCVKVKRQPLEIEALSEIVPNCGLEEFSIEFEEDEMTSYEEIDTTENYKNAFNSFLQNLKNLKHLEIMKCPSLREMPEEVCRSTQLITLRMKSCNRLERLTESFGQLTVLRELCFDDCTSLKDLSSTFCHLKSLTVLHLLSCQNLETFPPSFGQLTSLEKLFIYSCTNLKELPSTFGQLKSLKQLEIKWCMSLEDLSDKFGELAHLTKLDLVSCTSLEKLPSTFDQLKGLRVLIISYCVGFKEYPSIVGNLESSLDHIIFEPIYEPEVCK